MKFFYPIIIFLFIFPSCGGSDNTVMVEVKSSSGATLGKFQAEVADDGQERAMGLMFREELGAGQGMLFIFPQDTATSFWMQNTLISLDIIFITSDHKILNIVESATPQTTTPRSPEGPYRYVLEIPGGRSAELGIKSGDEVLFNL